MRCNGKAIPIRQNNLQQIRTTSHQLNIKWISVMTSTIETELNIYNTLQYTEYNNNISNLSNLRHQK